MFGSSNLPSPLSDPGGGGGGESAAGDQIVAFVTPEIVPVRIVNTNALSVVVTNFPGQPSPLPGLRPGATPPPLPTKPPPKKPAGMFDELGLGDVGLGGVAKLATAVGVVTAVVAGLGELKKTFIDPILGEAKSGFDRGVSRGAGVEVLGKTFEVLGVTIGVTLMPNIIHLAAVALDLAEAMERQEHELGQVKDAGESLVAPQWLGFVSEKGDSTLTKGLKGLATLAPLGTAAIGINPFANKGRKGEDGKAHPFSAESMNATNKESLNEVVKAMRDSMGGHGQFVGVADIRAQAQMAAMQDPLEAKMRKLLIQSLERYLGIGGAGPGGIDTGAMFRQMMEQFSPWGK